MKVISVLGFLIVVLMSTAFGQCNQDRFFPHRFCLGLEFSELTVHENIDGVHVSGSNFFSGLHFGYEYLEPCSVYAGIDLFGLGSFRDFKAKQNEVNTNWKKSEKEFGNIELRLGYSFFSFRKLLISPFVGIGIFGIFSGDHYNDQGLREDLPYLAAGVRIKRGLCYALDLGLNGKVLRTFNAEQRFKLADETVKSSNNFLGCEIGIPLIWHIGCAGRWDFQLEPYYLRVANNVYGLRTLFGYNF